MKKFAILTMIIGVTILGYACFQLIDTGLEQKEKLAAAKEIISNNDNTEAGGVASFSPVQGETAGILKIPKLSAELPIIEGTDEDELKKGVGHYKGTVYPEGNDQILLSGHRDTVFRDMGELELGDILTVQVPYGDFSYEIVETKIVSADDTTIIQSTAPNEVLTLSTCYPFHFIGSAPDRYIIQAVPVK